MPFCMKYGDWARNWNLSTSEIGIVVLFVAETAAAAAAVAAFKYDDG